MAGKQKISFIRKRPEQVIRAFFCAHFSINNYGELLSLCIFVKSPNYLAIQQASQFVQTEFEKSLLHNSNKTKNST
jgi:hypothetical protein